MSILNQIAGLFSRSMRDENQLLTGMEHAKAGRTAEAIEAYDVLLKQPSIGSELRAKALFNRALAHSSNHDDTRALADLKTLLATANLPENIQTAARSQMARVKKRNE